MKYFSIRFNSHVLLAKSANNQRLLFLGIHILCGLLRRITLPTDLTICFNGGYQETWNGIVFIRNPASPTFIPLTHCIFKLLTYCHALHSSNSPLLQTSFSFLSTMTGAEKAVYLQQQENNEEINALSSIQTNSLRLSADDRRLHNRFSSFLDRLEILIGIYFTFKPDLYKLKDSLNIIGTTLFASLDCLPEFRLRNIIRYCFLPLVRHCPMNSMLIVIFESLLPFIYAKLKDKWKTITERQTLKVTDRKAYENNEDNHQTQGQCEEEVIEEQVRIIFRVRYRRSCCFDNNRRSIKCLIFIKTYFQLLFITNHRSIDLAKSRILSTLIFKCVYREIIFHKEIQLRCPSDIGNVCSIFSCSCDSN